MHLVFLSQKLIYLWFGNGLRLMSRGIRLYVVDKICHQNNGKFVVEEVNCFFDEIYCNHRLTRWNSNALAGHTLDRGNGIDFHADVLVRTCTYECVQVRTRGCQCNEKLF